MFAYLTNQWVLFGHGLINRCTNCLTEKGLDITLGLGLVSSANGSLLGLYLGLTGWKLSSEETMVELLCIFLLSEESVMMILSTSKRTHLTGVRVGACNMGRVRPPVKGRQGRQIHASVKPSGAFQLDHALTG
jgi:hypothetical protein